MRIILLAICLAMPDPAVAQMSPALCDKLQRSVNNAADASNGYLQGVDAADVSAVSKVSNGELKEAADRLGAARQKIMPALREYVAALQDLGYQLRRCAR